MATAAVGVQFKRSNMDGTPTFTAIAEINDITGPNMSRDTIDTTSLDTTGGYRTFIGGFRDVGEIQLEMNFTLDGYDDLKLDFEDDDPRDYQIVFPDTGATTFGFSALVTSLGMKLSTADKITASVTLKILMGSVTDHLAFYTPLTSTTNILTPPRAYPGTAATFSRASAQYITDYQGVIRKVESGSVAVEGSRVVTNLLTYSEDLSNAAWIVTGTATKSAGNVINYAADNDAVQQTVTTSAPVGSKAVIRVTLSGSGTTGLQLKRSGSGSLENTLKTITLTTTPTTYSISHTILNTGQTGFILILHKSAGSTATSVTVHNAQLENVTAQSNTNPGEYVKTTSAAVTKCFSTTNGNTVDANGVVTEATGTSLPTSYSERQNSTAYVLGDKIQVSGWWYYCTTAGTSASSAPTFPQGKAGSQTVTDGSTLVWTLGGRLLLGYSSEPASTNNTTAYGIIPADTLGSELASPTDLTSKWVTEGTVTINDSDTFTSIGAGGVRRGLLTAGKVYQITFTASSDTTWDLKSANSAGTSDSFATTQGTYTFVAKDVQLYMRNTASGTTNFSITSLKELTWAVGTKSFHNGSAFVQNITGLVLEDGTSSTISIADDAAISNSGLSSINPTGKIYKFDNSAGADIATLVIAGLTGNTNPHSYYVLIRGGAGLTRLIATGAAFAGSASYIRHGETGVIPSSATRAVRIVANAGQTLYFLLPVLEELSYSTSLNPSAGSTSTRAATVLSYPVAGNLTSPLWSAKITATPAAASQDGKFFLGSYLDANNSVGLLMSGANAVARKRLAGSNNDATKALTLVAGTTKRFGLRGSGSGWSLFVDGVKGTDSANTATPAAGTTLQIGLDGNSGNGFTGYFRDLHLYNKPLAHGRF